MTRASRKSAPFNFRLTQEQKATVERMAQEQQKTASEFVRDLVLQEIGRKVGRAA